MQHHIPTAELGPRGKTMAGAVASCVHCGFCLPTCPTYQDLGEEMDSPRGRILLMKGVLEGELELEPALPYVDRCLGCVACQTACPSGVAYGDLLISFRARAEPLRQRSPAARLLRRLLRQTLASPERLRRAARLAPLGRSLRRLLPLPLASALDLLPSRLPPARPLPALTPALGVRRARVALLAGCAQQALAPEIGHAALEVLSRSGVEVVVPPAQGCCGSLALHAGEDAEARAHARHNLAAFAEDVDAVLTTAAGCGSGMRDYPLLLAGEPDAAAAERLAARVEDVTTFLAALGSPPPPPLAEPLRLVYHDACHLAHAQKERSAPRVLLASIEGLTLVEPAEWELCCGSAGLYNLEQPEIAARLGERKAHYLLAAGGDAIASGNVGCLMQIRRHAAAQGSHLPVLHTLEVLDRAWRGVPIAAPAGIRS